MTYDYRKLKGKIKEVFDTQQAFALAIGVSACSVTNKMQGKSNWTQDEIDKAANALKIDVRDIPEYFFTRKILRS